MRDGAEYFTEPASAAQRRYQALRAYFTDEMPAAEVADRFGYSTASIHQMATLLRKGRLNLDQGTVIRAVDRAAAPGQVRPQAPRLPRRDAGRRRRAGVRARPDRPAQDDPPGHLLLAHPPRGQPRAADRAGQGAAAARPGHWRGRVQLRLPCWLTLRQR